MPKLIVLYGHPSDPAHFRDYYERRHVPLAATLPNLLRQSYSFSLAGPGGSRPEFFCMWEGEFANEADMMGALMSPKGDEVAKDTANYATGGVTILLNMGESSPQVPEGSSTFDAGLAVRRDMFGRRGSDDAIANAGAFTAEMQDLVTRYCFGEIWTRNALTRKTRSLLTLATLVPLSRPNQIKTHIAGAMANGATVAEIKETLLHAMIYAGVPAGVDSFNSALELLEPAPATKRGGGRK